MKVVLTSFQACFRGVAIASPIIFANPFIVSPKADHLSINQSKNPDKSLVRFSKRFPNAPDRDWETSLE